MSTYVSILIHGHQDACHTLATVHFFHAGDCYKVVLGNKHSTATDNTVYFVPKASTVCFECAISTVGNIYPGVMWLIEGQSFSNNDHFYNGRVMSNGTLMITNSSKMFKQNLTMIVSCANNLQDPTAVSQLPIGTFDVHLGGTYVLLLND